jgi:outer membrane protein OmpA-like peptidoglycan-associated protein
MEWEVKQKFAFIQALFTPNEAQVYRKMDNVLISAHGFYFPSGEDEIQASNFGLLNKILSAINQFPKANISVSGHTDSMGSAELNLALSEKRAENVANFIMNMGRISADRITYKGYGDTRPIASNKTEDGRAQNRRIELMIINEE